MSTAEIKYPKRFLDLNMNSPVEDSKLAYDEMAACWEKVNMNMNNSLSGQDTAILPVRDYPLCPARQISSNAKY